MKTEEDVAAFYSKQYERLVKFAMNEEQKAVKIRCGKREDGSIIYDFVIQTLDREDAEDMISDIMIGHLANPSEMNIKYIYNRIVSRRINKYRDEDRKVNALSELKHQPVFDDIIREYDIDEKMVSRLIREDIKEIEDEVVKEVVSRHIILGETIREAVRNVPYANQVMVYQFLEETKEKYSSILSEND